MCFIFFMSFMSFLVFCFLPDSTVLHVVGRDLDLMPVRIVEIERSRDLVILNLRRDAAGVKCRERVLEVPGGSRETQCAAS